MGTLTNKELFFNGFVKILKEQEVDLRLKAWDSDKDAAISAHKLILSARSEVLKKMLESDKCKASSMLETITLSELKHEELEVFVELIYSDGSMLSKKAKQHVMSLYRAAEKYEIPYLCDLCRNELITLNSLNALKVLELSQIPFDQVLFDAALTRIIDDKITISNSTDFKSFVANHPCLTVTIVKAVSAKGHCCIHCRRFFQK